MVDTVSVVKMGESDKFVHYLFLGQSDGTGESNVQKIDISTLTIGPVAQSKTVTALALVQAQGNVSTGQSVKLSFDQGTDVVIAHFTGDVMFDAHDAGGIQDTGSAGTGDVLLSTVGFAAADTYTLLTKWRKKA